MGLSAASPSEDSDALDLPRSFHPRILSPVLTPPACCSFLPSTLHEALSLSLGNSWVPWKELVLYGWTDCALFPLPPLTVILSELLYFLLVEWGKYYLLPGIVGSHGGKQNRE